MKNKPRNKWKVIKKFIYYPCNKIIVTDTNRKELMPDFVQEKVYVIENYPFRIKKKITKKSNSKLTIFIFRHFK